MARKKRNKLAGLTYALFKPIFRHPLIGLFLCIVIGGWYAYEVQIARPEQVYMGLPISQQWPQPLTWVRVFRNPDFMLGYSDLRGNPLWVSYQLKPIPKNGLHYKRPSIFKEDWRSINKVKHRDYTNSGFDRGHLAPNYAISSLYGKQAQLDTFLMSNITPQSRQLNQKLWQHLEETAIKQFTQLHELIWVMTGPIFTGDTERLKSAVNVEIPDAFYKIFISAKTSEKPQVLAFVMPQKVAGSKPLAHYLSNVDDIETLTGLDFFSELEDVIEEQLEATIDPEPWQLQ